MAIHIEDFDGAAGTRTLTPGFRTKVAIVTGSMYGGYGSFQEEAYFRVGIAIGTPTNEANQFTNGQTSAWNGTAFFGPRVRRDKRAGELISDINNAGLSDQFAHASAVTDTTIDITFSLFLASAKYQVILIGGADVDVAIGTGTTPAAPGALVLAPNLGGRAPDFYWLQGGHEGQSTDGGHFSSGFWGGAGGSAVSAYQQFGDANGNAGTPTRVHSIQRADRVLYVLDDEDGTVLGEAAHLSVDVDEIQVDFLSVPAAQEDFKFLAIAGITALVQTFLSPPGIGIDTVPTAGVLPEAVLVQSCGLPASTALQDDLRFSFGVGNGTRNFAIWNGDDDGVGSIANRRTTRYRSNALALVHAHPTGTNAGAIDAAAAVDALRAGSVDFDWAQADATARQSILVALGTPVTTPAPIFSRDGALQGLEGPLIWIEMHHPLMASPLVISPIFLADPMTYYYGPKVGLVMRVDVVQLALADKAGQPQANRFSFEMADFLEGDTFARIRTWLGTVGDRAIRRVEIVARMITDAARRRLLDPVTVFRGRIDEYEGSADFTMKFDCLGWYAPRLDRPVLTTKVQDLFPNAPPDTSGLVMPLLLGLQSDEGSATAAPIITLDEAGRGSALAVSAADNHRAGFGDLPVAAPTGVTAGEVLAAGNINLGLVPGNYVRVWWTRVVAGVEGNPDTFLVDAATRVDITANGSAVHSACNNDGADAYRCYLGFDYFGTRATQYIETVDPVTGVDFTELPALGSGGPPITPGAVYPFHGYGWAAVLAVMADGRTKISSPLVFFASEGGPRPVRFAWLAIPGAQRYEVFWGDPTALTPNGVTRRQIIQTTHVNLDGNPYAEFDWGTSLPLAVPQRPVGKIPPRFCGDVVAPGSGATHGLWAISVRPGAFVTGYIGGVSIAAELGVNAFAPGTAGWATELGAADLFWTVTNALGTFRILPILLRKGSLIYDAALNAQVDPGSLPASSAAAIIGTGDSELQIIVDEPGVGGNAYSVQVQDGVGLNQPLLAFLSGTSLIVILATDGAGVPDDAANTALKVAQVVNAVAGFSAGITAGGQDPVVAQAAVPFGGGSDGGALPGNPWSGEFRVNATGCDDADDGSGAPIDDGFDMFELMVNSLLMNDAPSVAGAWPGTVPTYVDGTERLDTASVAQCKADAGIVVPAGNVGGLWLADDTSWGQWLADWGLSFGAKPGFNEEGQLTIAVRNPYATVVAEVDDKFDILARSFRWRDSPRGFATRTPYEFAPRYNADGGYEFTETTGEESAPARAAEYDEDPEDDVQGYLWRDGPGAASQLAAASLVASQHPVRVAEGSSVLHWLHFPIGRAIAWTHPEGPDAGGWVRRRLQILGKRLAPDACTITLTLDDLRTEVDDLSFFESEEIMAGHYIGGSTADSLFTDPDDGILKPVNCRKFVVDWDKIPIEPVEYGKRVRAMVRTDGTIRAAIFAFGEDPIVGGDTEIAKAAADHASASWGEQVFDLPRPPANGEVEYWLLPILGGGATEGGSKMIADLEGYAI